MADNYHCVDVVPLLVVRRDNPFCRMLVLVEENGVDSWTDNISLHISNSKFHTVEFAQIANVR